MVATAAAHEICSTHVGLSGFVSFSSNDREPQHNFPFRLSFVPTADSQEGDQEMLVDDLAAEFAGTLVMCCVGHVYLGKIKIRSRCSLSAYGDQMLHIRHQRIEVDWAVEPGFKKDPEHEV